MKNRAIVSVILFAIITCALGSEDVNAGDQLETSEDTFGTSDAITIKLDPGVKRKKGDVRGVVERLRALPELRGTSLAAASRDLLVLIPGAQQSLDELKEVLLRQPDVYELEAGEELFRRPGDKPYDQLRKEKLAEVLSSTKTKIHEQIRNKLRSLLQGRGGKGKSKRGAGKAAGDAARPGKAAAAGEATAPGGARNADKAAAKAIKRAAKRAARRAKRQAAKAQKAGEEL